MFSINAVAKGGACCREDPQSGEVAETGKERRPGN